MYSTPSRRHLTLLLLLAPCSLSGQKYALDYDKKGPEALILNEAVKSNDDGDLASLLDQYLVIFPRSRSLPWVYDQYRQIADRANQNDKVIDFSLKILELLPDDLYSMDLVVRLAEAKKDTALANRWSESLQRLAQATLDQEQKSPAQTPEAKARLQLAREVNGRLVDKQFFKIADEPDVTKRAAQLEAFLKANPDTEYRKQINPMLFYAYRTAGNHQKSYEIAERMLKENANDEDALIFIADSLFSRRSAPDRVMNNSLKVLEILRTKEKPSWYTDAQWNQKKAVYTGSAHWMLGHIQLERLDFVHADASFRMALPFFARDAQTSGYILYYLGWANYNLGKWEESAKAYEQCAAIQGTFQAQASRNVAIVKGQQKAQLAAPDLTAGVPPVGGGLVALGAQKFF